MVQFRVLGPLEVLGDDGPLAVAGNKERVLLGLLLAQANGVVSADDLVEGLWGEDPPPTAEKSLQAHVVRLRDALEPDRRRGTPGTLIQTREPGYLLAAAPDAIDAERFERLAAEGRRALMTGAAATADQLLRESLSLWRGTAYAGLEAGRLTGESLRLEELRRAAADDQVEAELALGRHREVIARLEEAVARDPFRERSWAQLMLALYRSGRQSDALAAYHRARAALADELGLDPGDELEQLQHRILVRDPSLLEGLASGRRDRLSEVLEVPESPFVGREAALAELLRWWDMAVGGRPFVGMVAGPQGIGKTRLAAELVHQIGAGGVVLYASASPATSDWRALLQRLAAAIDRPDLVDRSIGPRDLGRALGTAVRRLTSADPLLLVLDDLIGDDPNLPEALAGLLDALDAPRALFLCLGEQTPPVAGLEADGALELGPLTIDAIYPIAALYAGDDAAELASADVAAASGGVPALVHREAASWARRAAADRIEAAAEEAADRRAALGKARRALAAGIADWQQIDHSGDDPEPAVARPSAAPYKGLARFEVEDSTLFFGREELVGALAARLAEAPFLALVGPSGSGKSSLARAGLLAALERGVLPGSDTWPHSIVTLGEHPDEAIAAALDDGPPGGGRRVLLIDQAEQLFTACDEPDRRRAALDRLADLATAPRSATTVILALRADYYGHVTESPRFAALMSDAVVTVGPMSVEEVQRAVELPARRSGLRLEPGLAAVLAAEVANRPGALPLLSTTLLELWEQRRDGWLTWSAFRRSGGLRGAVARLAEDAFSRLNPQDRLVARRILLRTAGPGESPAEVGRRVPLAELLNEGDAGRRVLAALADRRLLVVDDEAVEVAHEALYREWPRLRDWLQEDRNGRELHRHLISAAREWHARGRNDADLYRGPRLVAAWQWASEHPDELNERERSFVEEGRRASEREAAEARERAELTARSNRRLRMALAGVAALLVVAVAAAGIAAIQSDAATRSAVSAEAARLGAVALTQQSLDRSLLLAVQARKLDASIETDGALLAALARSPSTIRILRGDAEDRYLDVAASPDGRLVALGSNQGNIQLWDWQDGRRIRVLESREGFHIAFTPDGGLVLAAEWTPDGTIIRRWQIETGVELDPYQTELQLAGDGSQAGVAFESRRPEIAFLTVDGELVLLDLTTGGARAIASIGSPVTLTAASDGERFAIASSERVVIVDRLGQPVSSVELGELGGASVEKLAISPDSELLAVGTGDGSAHAINATTGTLVARAVLHTEPVKDVTFTPDHRYVISSSDDGAVAVWEPATGVVRRFDRGHSGRVFGVAVTPDGRTLFSASTDGTGIVWDLTDERRFGEKIGALPPDSAWWAADQTGQLVVAVYPDGRVAMRGGVAGATRIVDGGIGPLGALAMHPDGGSVAVAGERGEIALIDAREGVPVGSPLPGRGQPIAWLAYAPDGTALAASDLSSVWVIDPTGGSPSEVIVDEADSGWAVTYDPLGSRLAAGFGSGEVEVWELGPPRRRQTLSTGDTPVSALDFDPTGSLLVSGNLDGGIRLWDVVTGEQLGRELRSHAGFVLSARFSADGSMLVTTGTDGTVALWDVPTRRQVGAALVGSANRWGTTWFTADGGLLTLQEDGSMWSWSVDPADWRRRACAIAGRDFSEAEWASLIPDRPFAPACGYAPRSDGS